MAEQTVVGMATEVPVFFRGGHEQLFGVLTLPDGRARGIGVVVLTGGGFIAAPNRNRLSVRLAGRLASLGFHMFRFDYHGIGESTGYTDGFWLDRPYIQDLDGALSVMRQAGLRRLALVGACFGTRTILSAADHIPELETAVLMAAPVRDFREGDNLPMRVARDMSLGRLVRLAFRRQTFRALFAPPDRESKFRTRHVYKRTVAFKARMMVDRLLSPSRSLDRDPNAIMSENFSGPLGRLVDRGVPLLFLYGMGEGFHEEFTRVQHGRLRAVLERAHAPLEVKTLDGVLHGFSTLAVQDAAIEHTIAWLERILPS